MKFVLPWHEDRWLELNRIVESERLSHALLFYGRDGLGVEQLAFSLAAKTLCEGDDLAACGDCRACRLFQADTHPDFKLIAPSEQGKSIVVDQVREIAEFYALKSHYARAKVVLIHPANAMNRAASNAILKILEEPPPGALLLLVAHRLSSISMTIRSRCVRFACDQIDRKVALAWLSKELPELDDNAINSLYSLSGGAPLSARDLASAGGTEIEVEMLATFKRIVASPAAIFNESKNFSDLPLSELQRHLNSLTLRLILAKFGLRTHYERSDRVVEGDLQGLVDHLNLKNLYALLDLIVESKAISSRQSGLREPDLAESLWLGLADCAHASVN